MVAGRAHARRTSRFRLARREAGEKSERKEGLREAAAAAEGSMEKVIVRPDIGPHAHRVKSSCSRRRSSFRHAVMPVLIGQRLSVIPASTKKNVASSSGAAAWASVIIQRRYADAAMPTPPSPPASRRHGCPKHPRIENLRISKCDCLERRVFSASLLSHLQFPLASEYQHRSDASPS